MKKYILTLITLITLLNAMAQSSFYLGAIASFNRQSIINKEDDNAPSKTLQQIPGYRPSYSFQIGARIGKHLDMNIAPTLENFYTSYYGNNDTSTLKSFQSSLQFKNIYIPLQLNFLIPVNERIKLSLGIGAFYSKSLSYAMKTEAIQNPNNWGTIYWTSHNDEGLTGSWAYFDHFDTIKAKTSKNNTLFKMENIGISVQTGIIYQISNHIDITLQAKVNKTLHDNENKVNLTEVSDDGVNPPNISSSNCWSETRLYRFYIRPSSEFNKRPASTTLSIGVGLGVQFHFGRSSNSSSSNYYNY
jgi:hypothetical protein